jgi:hypothetical protein
MNTPLNVDKPFHTPPRVYVGNLDARPVDGVGRAIAALVSLGSLAVLIVAAWLVPDARGVGTHRQLGLAECEWIARYDTPCPACGMTTSFSYFVRARLGRAIATQPAGALLAAGAVLLVWLGGYVAVTAKPVHRLIRLGPARYVGLFAGGFFLLAWAWTIVRHRGGF